MEGICLETCLTCLGGIPYAQWPLELMNDMAHGIQPRPLSGHPDPVPGQKSWIGSMAQRETY